MLQGAKLNLVTKRNDKGQMLVEVMVALGIITTALVFAVSAATQSQRNARYVQNEMEANKHANAVIERLRNTKDSNPDNFFSAGTCGACSGVPAFYSCSLSCTFVGGNRANVTVTVSWEEAGSTRSVRLPTILTKYDK